MKQTLGDVEFIFVDDASPDDSVAKLEGVLARYPSRRCSILHHEANSGLPSSRRTGMGAATGEYVYNCDSDDWVEPDMLESMYRAAQENDADFVYCDFYLSFESNERYMHNPKYDSPDVMLREGFLRGATKYNVWNKLIRRSLYDGIEFPVEHFKGGEDMIMIEILAKARSVAYVPKGEPVRRTLVVSAVNLRKGGTLTILRQCLEHLSTLTGEMRVVALVHDRSLCEYPGIEYVEIPWSTKGWCRRLWCEYVTMHRISKEIVREDGRKVWMWLSMHDITPRVEAEHQEVYCHTSFPFLKCNLRDFWMDPKIVLFSMFTR